MGACKRRGGCLVRYAGGSVNVASGLGWPTSRVTEHGAAHAEPEPIVPYGGPALGARGARAGGGARGGGARRIRSSHSIEPGTCGLVRQSASNAPNYPSPSSPRPPTPRTRTGAADQRMAELYQPQHSLRLAPHRVPPSSSLTPPLLALDLPSASVSVSGSRSSAPHLDSGTYRLRAAVRSTRYRSHRRAHVSAAVLVEAFPLPCSFVPTACQPHGVHCG